MEEMQRAKYGEEVQSSHALSGCTTLLAPQCVHQPRSSLNPFIYRFYGGSFTQAQLIKPLVIDV